MIPIQNHQHFNFRFNQHFMNSKPYQIDWNVNVNEHKLSQSISSLCSAFTFCFLFGCFCEKHVKKRIIFRMLKHSKVVCETKMAHERLFLKSARMQFESFFYDSNVVFEYIIRFIDKLTFFFFERMV